uniref:Uncharacterized protein n=1 Tax=Strongyloides venezuelensis TaxID=75913 RepID=A0A0K0EY61_STRVS
MALFTFILCILFVKLIIKYNKVKSHDVTENGISVTKISKYPPVISFNVLESLDDNSSYINEIDGNINSSKSIVTTPVHRDQLEPGDLQSQKRQSAESMKFSKTSARSFSEVFEELSAMKLDRLVDKEHKTNTDNNLFKEPISRTTQRPSIISSISMDIESLKNGKIINKRIEKHKPNPKDRILKKIDSSVIMFKGEPIYNITKNSDKPGEYKL